MPLCIECRYPVPQLYHVLHSGGAHKPSYSTSKLHTSTTPKPQTPSGLASPKVTNPFAATEQKAKPSGVFGGDVRLTQCPRCKRFADKYVEHDFVVLFIDLVLVKPQVGAFSVDSVGVFVDRNMTRSESWGRDGGSQGLRALFIILTAQSQVYRHLLFNRLGRDDDQFDVCILQLSSVPIQHVSNPSLTSALFKPSIIRLGTLLLLFDVYITWSSIESLPLNLTASSAIPTLPILLQYAFYLILCTLTTLAQHLAIRTLAGTAFFSSTISSTSPTQPHISGTHAANPAGDDTTSDTGYNHRPNAISTAILVSSCMKLFPILMVVWKYDDVGGQVGHGVQWAVALQNLEALRILLGCSYWGAGMLVGTGAVVRWVVGRVVLGLFGLGDVGGSLVSNAA
ncbi:sterol homeostasis protein [Xylographa opegraphella]|nr:sterol homeostasis protein [Xylographa opegraphella]